MSNPDRPSAQPAKAYFDLKPEELPLYKLRQLVAHWVLPFNNLFVLCSTLGINAAIAGFVDLASPKLRLFPWLTAVALLMTVVCIVLQTGLRPSWSAGARRTAVGRLMLQPFMVSFSAMLLLLSVAGSAWAQAHPGGRGALAAQSPTLQSLQDTFLGLRSDVIAVREDVRVVNNKLDHVVLAQAAAQSEAASRQARAAARPEALGLLSLSLLPGTSSDPATLRLHLAAYMNAPGMVLRQAHLLLQTRNEPTNAWTSRDLSPQLAGAAEQQTMQFNVPRQVRELRLCLAADYPDAAHPHAVRTAFRLDAAQGDQALQPVGSAQLLPAMPGPCGA